MRSPALLALATLVGCEPDPDIEPPACRNVEAGTAEIGAGDLASGFIPLSSGSDIRVALGPQGQHMVTMSLQVDNLELPSVGGGRVPVSIGIRKDGELVGGTVAEVPPSSVSDGLAEILGLRVILTADEITPLADGMSNVSAVIVDGCGREILATNTLRLVQ